MQEPKGSFGMELFHVEREGKDFLLNWELGGTGMSFGVMAEGNHSAISRAMDMEIDNLERGAARYHVPFVMVAEKIDAKAQKHLDIMDDSTWGVAWEGDPPESEMEHFYKGLARDIKEWRGGSIGLSATRHSFWPEFHKMVVQAVQREYGGKVKLWRGVVGDMAKEVLQGAAFPTHLYASWTTDKLYAKDFAIDRARGRIRGDIDFWIVAETTYPASSVMFAPVVLPEFAPNPEVLLPFAVEDEFVIKDRRRALKPGQFKVVQKTRKTRKQMARDVAARYLRG